VLVNGSGAAPIFGQSHPITPKSLILIWR
jgi:hypothetical protein